MVPKPGRIAPPLRRRAARLGAPAGAHRRGRRDRHRGRDGPGHRADPELALLPRHPHRPLNYPVWIVTSALMGLLIATYVAPPGERAAREESTVEVGERRDARTGTAAGMLAWFAVGCPVCNKIALLALGYSGALTWFAPAQPFLAALALALALIAVVSRLRGQVACPMPAAARAHRVAAPCAAARPPAPSSSCVWGRWSSR